MRIMLASKRNKIMWHVVISHFSLLIVYCKSRASGVIKLFSLYPLFHATLKG